MKPNWKKNGYKFERKPRKGATERPCWRCGEPIHNAPDRLAADGKRQLYAWANRDESHHRCNDFLRVRLDVPYAEKEQAKALGARWDASNKSWYAPSRVDVMRFAKWNHENAKWHGVVQIKGRLTPIGAALRNQQQS